MPPFCAARWRAVAWTGTFISGFLMPRRGVPFEFVRTWACFSEIALPLINHIIISDGERIN